MITVYVFQLTVNQYSNAMFSDIILLIMVSKTLKTYEGEAFVKGLRRNQRGQRSMRQFSDQSNRDGLEEDIHAAYKNCTVVGELKLIMQGSLRGLVDLLNREQFERE